MKNAVKEFLLQIVSDCRYYYSDSFHDITAFIDSIQHGRGVCQERSGHYASYNMQNVTVFHVRRS